MLRSRLGIGLSFCWLICTSTRDVLDSVIMYSGAARIMFLVDVKLFGSAFLLAEEVGIRSWRFRISRFEEGGLLIVSPLTHEYMS